MPHKGLFHGPEINHMGPSSQGLFHGRPKAKVQRSASCSFGQASHVGGVGLLGTADGAQ